MPISDRHRSGANLKTIENIELCKMVKEIAESTGNSLKHGSLDPPLLIPFSRKQNKHKSC